MLSLALGRTEEEESHDNLHRVTRVMRNQCGIMFTNESKAKVLIEQETDFTMKIDEN